MKHGARVHVPVSIAETRISKRYDAIPSGTLYPNADEIKYLQRLVIYKACLTSNAKIIFTVSCYYSYCSIGWQYILLAVYCVQCIVVRTRLLLC